MSQSFSEGRGIVRKNSKKRSRIILGAAVASALAGLTASSAQATDYTWVGNTTPWTDPLNWNPNTDYPRSTADNATFANGALNFNVSLDNTVQNVNMLSFTNNTGSYNLSGGGSQGVLVLNGLSQTGSANNTISSVVSSFGAWTVSGGTLNLTNEHVSNTNNFNGQTVTVSGGATFSATGGNTGSNIGNAASGANIVLDGGTFRANGVFSGQNQLLVSYFDTGIDQLDPNPASPNSPGGIKYARLAPGRDDPNNPFWADANISTGRGLLTLTANGYGALKRELSVHDQGQGGQFGVAVDAVATSSGNLTNHGDFAMAWTGKLNVSAANAGEWNFATNSDDGSVIYIDFDNDGIFERTNDPNTTELVVNNNWDQGPTDRNNLTPGGRPLVNLAEGSYNIAIAFFEGRVTGEVTAGFISPEMRASADPLTPIDPNNRNHYAIITPGSTGSGPSTDPLIFRPNQVGQWSFDNSEGAYKYKADYSNTNVSVNAGSSSTVEVDAVSASFGTLTMGAGATLNVAGSGPATFTATTGTGTLTFNTARNLSTGALGGAIDRINKQGSGALIIEGINPSPAMTTASTIAISSGTVQARSEGTNSSISGATISLDGGTFVARSNAGIYGLTAHYFDTRPNNISEDSIDPIDNLINRTPITGRGLVTGPLAFSDGAEIGDPIIGASNGVLANDQFAVLYHGRLNISADNAGVYTFGTVSDDGTTLWIDLDHDGKFEYSTDPATNELIVNNNVYQGPTRRTNNTTTPVRGKLGHPNLNLAAGSYDFAMGWYEGGGGAEAWATIQGPATGGAEAVINPNGNGQVGLWTTLDPNHDLINQPIDGNFSTSDVNVTQNSTIDVFAHNAQFADLTIAAGRTLTIAGQGTAGFTSTTASGGQMLLVTDPHGVSADMRPGVIVNGGGLTGITKGGGGNLILDDTSAPSALTSAMNINIQGGGLVITSDGVNNPAGTSAITLAPESGLTLSAKTANPVTFNNAVAGSGNIRITAANRGALAVDAGNVTLQAINAADGSTLHLASNNGYALHVGNVNLAGNATVVQEAFPAISSISMGNITGNASSVVTFIGNNRPRITGNVLANNLVVNTPAIDFDPGTAVTSDVNSNATVSSVLRARSGVVDFEGTISGVTAVAGLYEGFVSNIGQPNGNINLVAANPNTAIQLSLRRANQLNVNTDPGENSGWVNNRTYIYSGQIFIPDNDTLGDGLGKISFGENFDDWTEMKIDGVSRMSNGGWDIPSSTGTLTLAAGWHDVEFRFGQGGGGVGPAANNGWGGTKAFGMDPTGGGTVNGESHIEPVDNGFMSLFRVLNPAAGTAGAVNAGSIEIAAGAELRAGRITTLHAVNMDGNGQARLTINDHATGSESDVDNINVIGGGLGGSVSVGNNARLTTKNLNLRDGNTLTKVGPGVLRVASNLHNDLGVTVEAGKLQLNNPTATGFGGIVVKSGAALGGSGVTGGLVNVESGGILSPHDSATGVNTLTVSDSLTLNSGSLLNFNFNGVGDMVNVLNNLTLAGNSTLNINALAGFTTGTYPLIKMVNFTDTGDIVLGTNNGPNVWTYSILETPTEISLVVAATQLEWRGTVALGDPNTASWEVGGPTNWVPTANPAIPVAYQDLQGVTFDDDGIARNVVVSASGVSPSSITVNSSGNYAIGGGPIVGPTGITKSGTGALDLTGSNSFLGPVIVEGGTVNAASVANAGTNSALGAGSVPVTLGGASSAGTLAYTGGAAGSTDRGLTLAAGGGTVNTGTGLTFGGIISGDGALTKTGAGNLTLSGLANTHGGSLNISEGTVSAASLGAGAAGSTITLGTASSSGTLEYTGASHTGARGLTIPSAGTVNVTTAATNLTLGGATSGPTITKAGPGTLTLGGKVNFTGATHSLAANSGTLALTNAGAGANANTVNGTFDVAPGSVLASHPGSLGTAAVTLSGGTLRLTGAGLNGEFFSAVPTTAILADLGSFQSFASTTPVAARANTILADRASVPNGNRGAIANNAGNGNPFSQYDVSIGNDNIVGRWFGKIVITPENAGDILFTTASDDGSALWIDGVKVVDNNVFQGVTARQGTINLTPGIHDIEIGFYEGGGGAGMLVGWAPPGKATHLIPNNVLMSTALETTTSTNNVAVAPGTNSLIEAFGVGGVGQLTIGDGATLRVTGGLKATGTTVGGTTTIDTAYGTLAGAGSLTNPALGGVNIGSLSGSGTFNKNGAGLVVIETNNTAGLAAGSVVNINGGNLAAVGGNGQTNPLGAASVVMAGGSGLILGSESGSVTFDTPVSVASGTVRVQARPFGSAVVGGAAAADQIVMSLGGTNALTLGNNATVQMTRSDNTRIRLANVVLNGNATINNQNTTTGATVHNVTSTAAGNTLTFNGNNQRTRITGDLSAGNISVAATAAPNAFQIYFEPASGTSNVNAPVKLNSNAGMDVNSGHVTLGNNVITGQPTVLTAGLMQSAADGAFVEAAFTPLNIANFSPVVRLNLPQANMPAVNTDPGPRDGWANNRTYIYQGQFLVPDNGTAGDGLGTVAFAEQFDDNVLIRIDGEQKLRNTAWDISSTTGPMELRAGWHDIDIRVGQGGGGVGASGTQGWPNNFGVVVDLQGRGTLTPGDYQLPVDNGSMNMFRVATAAAGGTINVANGGTLTAGGMVDVLRLNLNADAGVTNVNLSNTALHAGSVRRLDANGTAGSGVNNLNLGANNTLSLNELNVAAGTILNLTGGGTTIVSPVPNAVFENVAPGGHELGAEAQVHVQAGKLYLNTNNLAGGIGKVIVYDGATLGGSGNIAGQVLVDPNGRLAPGASVGTLTVGALSLNGSTIEQEGSAAGLDKIVVSGADQLVLEGISTFSLVDLGGVAEGDYVLIDYNGTPLADPLANLTVTGNYGQLSRQLVHLGDTQDIILRVGGVVPNEAQWNVDSSGSWGTNTNWLPQVVPNGSDAIARLLGAITAPQTITLDGDRAVATLVFNNANKYTVAAGTTTPGTLTVGSETTAGLIDVAVGGSHEISAPVTIGGNAALNTIGDLTLSGGMSIAAGKAVSKTGTGTLTLSGAQSSGAGSSLAVSAGTVKLNSNAGGVGATGATLALSIGGGSGRVDLGADQNLKSLSVAFVDDGTQTLDLASPVAAGEFNGVTVYAADLDAAKLSLWNAIVNANRAGAPDPLDGIVDSGLHAGSGIGINRETDHVQIRATRRGDLNLDGSVTISDFIDLAQNFNTFGTATWQEGDINYDRNVTIADFIDLAGNFNSNYAGSLGEISTEDHQLLASFASSIGVDPSIIGSAVPEPGTLSVLAIGAMGLLGRRRRSRKA